MSLCLFPAPGCPLPHDIFCYVHSSSCPCIAGVLIYRSSLYMKIPVYTFSNNSTACFSPHQRNFRSYRIPSSTSPGNSPRHSSSADRISLRRVSGTFAYMNRLRMPARTRSRSCSGIPSLYRRSRWRVVNGWQLYLTALSSTHHIRLQYSPSRYHCKISMR